MMEAVRGWLTGVTAVAALLFLVRSLSPKGAVGRVAEFTGGLLLLLALLQPLKGLAGQWEMDLPDLRSEITQRQEELENYKTAVIEEETAAYKMDIQAEGSHDG